MTRRLVAALLFVLLSASVTSAQEFSCAFESDPGSTKNFCFDGKSTPLIPSGRTIEWLPTGGWNGTGAAKVTVAGCTTDCSTSSNQGNVGWDVSNLGGTPGGSKFLRFRFRLDGPIGSIGASKFIITPAPTSDGRVILKLARPDVTNAGCNPSGEGGGDYYNPPTVDTDPTDAFLRATGARSFGLGGTFSSMFSGGMSNYGMFVLGVNVGFNCSAFAIMPNTTGAAVADIKPQNNGALSQSGWIHYQFELVSGACGAADVRTWVNNNTQASPTTQALNFNVAGSEATCDIPNDDWDTGTWYIGGYWGQGSTTATAFVIDDVEISDTFDSSFYELAGDPPPATAYRFRFRTAELVTVSMLAVSL